MKYLFISRKHFVHTNVSLETYQKSESGKKEFQSQTSTPPMIHGKVSERYKLSSPSLSLACKYDLRVQRVSRDRIEGVISSGIQPAFLVSHKTFSLFLSFPPILRVFFFFSFFKNYYLFSLSLSFSLSLVFVSKTQDIFAIPFFSTYFTFILPLFFRFLKVIIYSLSLFFYFIARREHGAGYKLYLKRGVESCACLGTRIAFESLCATRHSSVEIIWGTGIYKVVSRVNRLNYLRGSSWFRRGGDGVDTSLEFSPSL